MAKRKPKTRWDDDLSSAKNRFKLDDETRRQIVRSKNPPSGDLGKHSVPGKVYQIPGNSRRQAGEPFSVGKSQSKKYKQKPTRVYKAKDLPKNSMISRYGRLTGGGSGPGLGIGQGGRGGGGFLKGTK
jgi:hypothetical protein